MKISRELRRSVQERAQDRCEYCGLSQSGQEALFHVDHVVPLVGGGATKLENLALACVSCSLRKGARQSIPDPLKGEMNPIFNPRLDRWNLHFRWQGPRVVGLTATGRATIAALHLNRSLIIAIREEEEARGRHPPRMNS